jgi:hypothetical protein
MRTNYWLAGLAIVTVVAFGSARLVGQTNMAHTHIGHVMTSFADTPDKTGLLPATTAEAQTAAQHAGLAAKAAAAGNTTTAKLHAGHVLQCLDPTLEPMGPCKGYGVKKGATAALQHVGLAAKVDTASANVKTHSTHVSTSLNNVIKWTDAAIAAAQKLRATSSTAEVDKLVAELQMDTAMIVAGMDTNKDGQVGWQEGEGGLQQATLHMQLMMKGEGIQ